MLRSNDGFTSTELMRVMAIIAIIGGILFFVFAKIVCQGNFWYTEKSVLEELKVDYPQISSILKTKRNFFDDSVIIVREADENKTYCLDTDAMWNYDFSPCEE